MTIYVPKGMKRSEFDKALQKMKSGKRLDAKRFCGVIKWNEDGLAYQKRSREEWIDK